MAFDSPWQGDWQKVSPWLGFWQGDESLWRSQGGMWKQQTAAWPCCCTMLDPGVSPQRHTHSSRVALLLHAASAMRLQHLQFGPHHGPAACDLIFFKQLDLPGIQYPVRLQMMQTSSFQLASLEYWLTELPETGNNSGSPALAQIHGERIPVSAPVPLLPPLLAYPVPVRNPQAVDSLMNMNGGSALRREDSMRPLVLAKQMTAI